MGRGGGDREGAAGAVGLESIERIRVGWRNYTLRIPPDRSERYGAFGQCDNGEAEIEVNACVAREQQAETLLHEIMHAITWQAGDSRELEREVTILSKGVMQVLRDNPAVAEFLMAVASEARETE